MEKDYQKLWEVVINGPDHAKTQALAEIVVDGGGRTFISSLEREAAKICMDVLDIVSRDLRLPISSPQMISPGHHRAQPPIRREAGFLPHTEETC